MEPTAEEHLQRAVGAGSQPGPVPGRVVVVGGAVLDTRLRLAARAVPGTSNRGRRASMPGGVGRNVAENLARLGRPTILVAPLGDDPAGRTVADHTAAAGVDCDHLVASPHPTGSYTAVLDVDGELLLAVADMRASDDLTVADLAGVPALLAGAAALVVDANPPPAVLRWLLATAADPTPGTGPVPTVLEPVSVAKAAAAAGALDPGAPVHTVTPNLDELAALVGAPVGGTDEAVLAAARHLHARGVDQVWVRLGARGSLLSAATPGPHGSRSLRAWRLGAPSVTVTDVTGAGDAMTAGYLHALLGGAGVAEAARYGQALAALTCASPHTVRPDLSPDLVADQLRTAGPTLVELT